MCLTEAYVARAAAADDEKHFVSHVLAFFAASDGIVVENLGVRFLSGIRPTNAASFDRVQHLIVWTHAHPPFHICLASHAQSSCSLLSVTPAVPSSDMSITSRSSAFSCKSPAVCRN